MHHFRCRAHVAFVHGIINPRTIGSPRPGEMIGRLAVALALSHDDPTIPLPAFSSVKEEGALVSQNACGSLTPIYGRVRNLNGQWVSLLEKVCGPEVS